MIVCLPMLLLRAASSFCFLGTVLTLPTLRLINVVFATAVQATVKRYQGATHAFIHFGSLADIPCSVQAIEDIATAMRQAVQPETHDISNS